MNVNLKIQRNNCLQEQKFRTVSFCSSSELLNKDTVELSSQKKKISNKETLIQRLRRYYQNINSNFLPQIARVYGEQIAPIAASAGDGAFSALYLLTMWIASANEVLFKLKTEEIDKEVAETNKECMENLPEDIYNIAKKRGLLEPHYIRGEFAQFTTDDINALAKLSDKEFEQAKELFYIDGRKHYKQFNGDEIAEFVKLPKNVFDEIKKLFFIKERGSDQYPAYKILKYAEMYEFIQKVKNLDPVIKKEIDKISASDNPDIENIMALAHTISDLKNNTVTEYSDYMVPEGNPAAAFIKINEKEKIYSPYFIDKNQLNLELKYFAMKEFVKHNPNSPVSRYLYENYYLKELKEIGVDEKTINCCKKLYDKYNTQTYLNIESYTYDCYGESYTSYHLGGQFCEMIYDYIEEEFAKWKKASKGKAKFPLIMDFSKYNYRWHDKSKGYVPYANTDSQNSQISFSRQSYKCVSYSLRHEMIHINSSEYYGIFDDFKKIKSKKEFSNELYSAGLDSDKVDYAYRNVDEFIAVAGATHTNKYSPKFKKLLIKLGLPEWVFDLDKD